MTASLGAVAALAGLAVEAAARPADYIRAVQETGLGWGAAEVLTSLSQARERVAMGPVSGTRPTDGRRPTTPQNPGGLRSEPPMSLPSAIGSIPVASETAAPPLDPP